MQLAVGSRLGPYEILSGIGAGGMGEVYRARDTRLGRDVAIKVLPSHLSGEPRLRERFEREARAISQLSSGARTDASHAGDPFRRRDRSRPAPRPSLMNR